MKQLMVDDGKLKYKQDGGVLSDVVITPDGFPKRNWYELDWMVPYCDLVMAAGACLVVGGIGMVYIPAAVIVAGSGLIYLSWRIAR